MRTKPMLRVLPNPYAADTDHYGRLHAHTQYEPNLVSGDSGLRWIGCRITATQTREANLAAQMADDWDHEWSYDTEPTAVPVTAYYLRALQHGDLIAGDLETHTLAFGGPKGFIEPHKRFAQLAKERGVVPEPSDRWNQFIALAPSDAKQEV